jgi:hypothetical protein
MAEGSIFLLRDGEFVEMSETPYDSEDLLQRYLEEHPKLLAGDQMAPEALRRWIVVSREIAMPGEERGVGYVDHAFGGRQSAARLPAVMARRTAPEPRILTARGP